ncbi:MAG: hypothetical protein WC796_02655 [Candidatus Pacearchaeota archaeon]|jgi:hypothetical protein
MDLSRSQNLDLQKEKIMDFLDVNGPSLPIHISNHLRVDTLLSSAFLADLLSEKKVKLSNMRVGNSPVYYLRGQEFQLDKFANFLSGKEKDTFYLLESHGVLRDDFMLPASRVALRAIKDFAFPFDYNEILYWRFIKINEEQAVEMIETGGARFNQIASRFPRYASQFSKKQEEKEKQEEVLHFEREEIPRVESSETEIKDETLIQPKTEEAEIILPVKEIEPIMEITEPIGESPSNVIEKSRDIEEMKELELDVEEKTEIEEKVPDKIEVDIFKVAKRLGKVRARPDFVVNVEKFLFENQISIVSQLEVKKKEYLGTVKFNGRDYLCIAKDKKAVSEPEILDLLKSGKKAGMPVLFICTTEPNKKALDWVDYLGNYLVFRKLG